MVKNKLKDCIKKEVVVNKSIKTDNRKKRPPMVELKKLP